MVVNKCNIASLVLHRLIAKYWGVKEKNIDPAILENYIEYLECPDVVADTCYASPNECSGGFVDFKCKFKILNISFQIIEHPDYDVIFYLANTDLLNANQPLSLIWQYNQNHFTAYDGVTGNQLRLKLNPGKTLSTLASKLFVSATSSDGCISTKQCYFVNGEMKCNPNYIPCIGASILTIQKQGNGYMLSWDNTEIVANTNTVSQIAYYREKIISGEFSTIGFIPSNPLDGATNLVISPDLPNANSIYEFKLEVTCAQNGPIMNENGLLEGIRFSCLAAPTITFGETAAQAMYDLSGGGNSITKIRFVLRKDSDNSIIKDETVTPVAGIFTSSITGLDTGTAYYYQTEYFSELNGVEVRSGSADQLNALCGDYDFITETPVCNPVTNIVIHVSP